MCSFVGCYDYLEHDLPAPIVSNSIEGCGKAAVVSYHKALSTSLAEAESRSQCWENDSRGSVERMAQAEEERDAARHDASMACIGC